MDSDGGRETLGKGIRNNHTPARPRSQEIHFTTISPQRKIATRVRDNVHMREIGSCMVPSILLIAEGKREENPGGAARVLSSRGQRAMLSLVPH
jgi:hypothetical protein